MDVMNPEHDRWDEFAGKLAGPDACDFKRDGTWTCDHTHGHARAILKGMGFPDGTIEETVAYFEENGGYCDCEVLFNVDR